MDSTMDKYLIPIHSITSLITNSSTIIYTHSEKTVKPFKKLINEVLKLIGEEKSCDELFELKIVDESYYEEDDLDYAVDYFEENIEDLKPYYPKFYNKENVLDKKKLFKLVNGVNKGNLLKPHWWNDAFYRDTQQSTYLEVTTKNPKYKKLAKLVVEFLYSTEHTESFG